METLADLELPWLPVEQPAFAADPFGAIAEARARHPWLARCATGYVVTEYAAIRELMTGHESQMTLGYADGVDYLGATDTPWGRFLSRSLLGRTGEDHKRLRDLLAPAFTPREANRRREVMRETIAQLLDKWVPEAAIDFELFASHFPVSVMCRIIGADPEVVPTLRNHLEVLGVGGSFVPAYLPRFQESFGVMDAFVRQLVTERRMTPLADEDRDLLDKLLRLAGDGEITDDELYNLLVFLFVAGYDTSKNVLTLIMNQLLDRPADYARCAREPEFCQRVVEEIFRYQGVSSVPRLVLEDFEFRGYRVPKGTRFCVAFGASGRDPEAFDRAESFDPERAKDKNHVMLFGLGPHICLGQYLARAQIAEGLHQIAQRMRNPRRAGENGWRDWVGIWGLRGLPIEFDPAPASAGA
jgi:cytochrome P450